jgi:hypothetical protein
VVLFAGSGCARRATTSPTPRFEVTHANYETAIDAVLDTLRTEQIALDRIDRRLCVITTKPRTSASFAEPWKVDNATVALAMESTVHYQRRIVRIQFRAYGQGAPSESQAIDKARVGFDQVTADAAPIFDAASHAGTLVMYVRCDIERAQRPGMQIQPIALRESNITTDPLLAERGIPARFWQPIDRDPYMEVRLADRIARRAGDALRVSSSTVEN